MQKTAGKAHAGALTTFVGVLLALLGLGDMPPGEEVETALKYLACAVAAAGADWLAVFWKRNRVKA